MQNVARLTLCSTQGSLVPGSGIRSQARFITMRRSTAYFSMWTEFNSKSAQTVQVLAVLPPARWKRYIQEISWCLTVQELMGHSTITMTTRGGQSSEFGGDCREKCQWNRE